MTNRRDVLLGAGSAVGVAGLSLAALALRSRHGFGYALGEPGASVESVTGTATPCTAGVLTVSQGEGPFYTPSTPRRRDIRDPQGMTDVLVLAGRVIDSQCRPISGAVLDFWQTGHDGRYAQENYGYRGHQYTDELGRFELVTVRPSPYTAMNIFRTPHIHVKVQGVGTRLLTTQLYLPDAEETNARDFGYDPALAIRYVGHDASARRAAFDFVLASS